METTNLSSTNQRFVRRTVLLKEERRVNFRQIDCDAIEVVTSVEACRQTPLISKIYLRLLNAGVPHREQPGVLRFVGCEKDGEWQTAWQQLLALVGVASATAIKALAWMHQEGVIGYDAHKNGVGIRIFLNRARTSIASATEPQKNLGVCRASTPVPRTSADDVPSKGSYAIREIVETDKNPHAPKNGAANAGPPGSAQPAVPTASAPPTKDSTKPPAAPPATTPVTIDEIVWRLRSELEPSIRAAAVQAAAREHQLTREWFESKAIPKAVRVAQKEHYVMMRKLGAISASSDRVRLDLNVGRQSSSPTTTTVTVSPMDSLNLAGIKEAAEVCVALFLTQGKSIESTICEISSAAGGWLRPEEAARARLVAEEILAEGKRKLPVG